MTLHVNLEVLTVMPSIRAAMTEIDAHSATRRVTVIRHPGTENDMLRFWLDKALAGAGGERLVRAAISGSSNVAMMIANAAQIQSLTPASQAADSCTGRRVHVLLTPLDEGAPAVIEDYVVAFMRSLTDDLSDGLRLYVVDAHLRHAKAAGGSMAVIELTDLLPREEMGAYVTLRMARRSGPSNTYLARALVEWFAGADARMAEALMGLSDDQLIGLPASLDQLLLPPMPSTARQQLMGDDDALVLMYDYHAHDARRRDAAKKKLYSLYRHACVHALMPWLEERRMTMVEQLAPVLTAYERRMGGLYRGTRDKPFPIQMDQVEFNDIYAWERHHDLRLATDWPQYGERAEACWSARRIRNGIAHSSGVRFEKLIEDLAQIERAFGHR